MPYNYNTMKTTQQKWKLILTLVGIVGIILACKEQKKETPKLDEEKANEIAKLKISENQRYFVTGDNEPFFWLGDTAWLLFKNLDREEAENYLENRKQKGFNVIQVSTVHSVDLENVYGDAAFVEANAAAPAITPGADPNDEEAYDYWDHVDYIIETAEKKGLYMALIPVWGSNVKGGRVNEEQAKAYGEFLAERYKSNDNVIWLNGGDTHGDLKPNEWNALGNALKSNNPDKLVSFHPFGRMQSRDWFNDATWLDFNMFQGGHRRYDQDDSKRGYGEGTWQYIQEQYDMKPIRPTLDGEPSYEGIPQGLHDTLQPFWNANDVRRYAYWSVFAGGAGFTYGHNGVMQMHKKEGQVGAYGNKMLWNDAIDSDGAKQMIHLKNLILEYPYFERIPDQSLVANQEDKYKYVTATRGNDYALIYTYDGRPLKINMGKISGDEVEASWYDPRTGSSSAIGTKENKGIQEFKSPGEVKDGNDWILVLKSKK